MEISTVAAKVGIADESSIRKAEELVFYDFQCPHTI
jgi:hypothetical protein